MKKHHEKEENPIILQIRKLLLAAQATRELERTTPVQNQKAILSGAAAILCARVVKLTEHKLLKVPTPHEFLTAQTKKKLPKTTPQRQEVMLEKEPT
jgi:hypothetical protein